MLRVPFLPSPVRPGQRIAGVPSLTAETLEFRIPQRTRTLETHETQAPQRPRGPLCVLIALRWRYRYYNGLPPGTARAVPSHPHATSALTPPFAQRAEHHTLHGSRSGRGRSRPCSPYRTAHCCCRHFAPQDPSRKWRLRFFCVPSALEVRRARAYHTHSDSTDVGARYAYGCCTAV